MCRAADLRRLPAAGYLRTRKNLFADVIVRA